MKILSEEYRIDRVALEAALNKIIKNESNFQALFYNNIPTKEERPDIDKRIHRNPPQKKEKKEKRTRIDIILEQLKKKEKE